MFNFIVYLESILKFVSENIIIIILLFFLIFAFIYLGLYFENRIKIEGIRVAKYFVYLIFVLVILIITILLNNINLYFFVDNSVSIDIDNNFFTVLLLLFCTIFYMSIFKILFEIVGLINIEKDVKDIVISSPFWLLILMLFTVSLCIFIQIIWEQWIIESSIDALSSGLKIDNYYLLLGVIMTFLFLVVTALSLRTTKNALNFEKDMRLNEKIEYQIHFQQERLDNLYVPVYEAVERFQETCSTIQSTASITADDDGLFTLDQIQSLMETLYGAQHAINVGLDQINKDIKPYILKYKHLSDNKDLVELIYDTYGIRLSNNTTEVFLIALGNEITKIHIEVARLRNCLIEQGVIDAERCV